MATVAYLARASLTYKIVFNCWLQEEDKSSFLDNVQVASNDSKYFQADGNIGGAVVLSNSFMFDGKEWKPLAPMSVPRASPACCLVDMDNGEVMYLILFSLPVPAN
jgi:hypothetical protein